MPTVHAAPYTASARCLTPIEAASIAKRGSKLRRSGELTYRELVPLDCMLWSCRQPETGAIIASYMALQRLAHQAREPVAQGIRDIACL